MEKIPNITRLLLKQNPEVILNYEYLTDVEYNTSISNNPYISHPLIYIWLSLNNIKFETLIIDKEVKFPIILLLYVYFAFTKNNNEYDEKNIFNTLYKICNKIDIDKYLNINNIKIITSQTLFPIALIYGCDIFAIYVNELQY